MQTVPDATDRDDPPDTRLHVGELGDANLAGTEGGDYKGSRPGVLFERLCPLSLTASSRSLAPGQHARTAS